MSSDIGRLQPIPSESKVNRAFSLEQRKIEILRQRVFLNMHTKFARTHSNYFILGLFTLGILLLVFKKPITVDGTLQAKHIVLYESIGGAVEASIFFSFLHPGERGWQMQSALIMYI
jgi:hypothetical protein